MTMDGEIGTETALAKLKAESSKAVQAEALEFFRNLWFVLVKQLVEPRNNALRNLFRKPLRR